MPSYRKLPKEVGPESSDFYFNRSWTPVFGVTAMGIFERDFLEKVCMSPITRFGLSLFCLCLILGGMAVNTSLAMKTATPPSSWFIDLSRYTQSAHAQLGCETCHGNMKELDRPHPDSSDSRFLKKDAVRKYDYKRCQSCHRLAYERYLQGAHAKALQKEEAAVPAKEGDQEFKIKAPTCGDCHSAHYEKAHGSRLERGRQMTELCGSCHPAQKVTYLENYHGKAAVHLGKTTAAFCTDCHGAHLCLSLKDRKEALQACLRCHPQASNNFAGLVIHPTLPADIQVTPEKAAKVKVITLVTLLMGALVLIMVFFFYGHSFLWLLREIHEKLKRPK